MTTAAIIITICWYYLGFGLAFAFLFLIFGVERVEPGARGSFAFRPLLVPGLCLIWPLAAWRWWMIEKKGHEH